MPADILLLRTSDSNGMCYIETKNLDGETNLKHKNVEKIINKRLSSDLGELSQTAQGVLMCEQPNDQIYKFEGSMKLNIAKGVISLSSENLLLRGSSVKNTEWVIGAVVYSGH